MSDQDNKIFLEDWEEEWMPSKEDRVLWAICYAHFFFLIPFFLEKDSLFIKFHMKQWWILYILFLLINIISMVFLPFSISWRLSWIVILGYTWLAIFAWYRAYKWEQYEFSFLSSLIEFVWEKLNEKK